MIMLDYARFAVTILKKWGQFETLLGHLEADMGHIETLSVSKCLTLTETTSDIIVVCGVFLKQTNIGYMRYIIAVLNKSQLDLEDQVASMNDKVPQSPGPRPMFIENLIVHSHTIINYCRKTYLVCFERLSKTTCGDITLADRGEVTKSVAKLPVVRLPCGEVTRIP